jgi:hypothetical protein
MQNIALCHGWRVELETEPRMLSMNYWEIIADNLKKAGWSWGCVSAVDSEGRTIWIADAHRSDGRRFIVSADEADEMQGRGRGRCHCASLESSELHPLS